MAKLSSLRNTATNLNHTKFWKWLNRIELEGEKFNDRTLIPSFMSKDIAYMTKRQLVINITLILSIIFSRTVKNSKYTLFGSCTGWNERPCPLCKDIWKEEERNVREQQQTLKNATAGWLNDVGSTLFLVTTSIRARPVDAARAEQLRFLLQILLNCKSGP